MNLDGMPHNPNRSTEASFVKCIEKIDEIQHDIEKKVSILIGLRDEINERINLLSDHDEQEISDRFGGDKEKDVKDDDFDLSSALERLNNPNGTFS